jgi:hypothetical protein
MNMAKGLSLHLGVNDPVDLGRPVTAPEYIARRLARFAGALGYQNPKVLLGSQASREAVLRALREARDSLHEGDMFLLTFAGHGGHKLNLDPTEAYEDAEDETWWLHDGQFVDDELRAMLETFRPGVRVIVVSESCYAGGMVQLFTRYSAQMREHGGQSGGQAGGPPMGDLPDASPSLDYRTWFSGHHGVTPTPKYASIRYFLSAGELDLAYVGARTGTFSDALFAAWQSGATESYLAFADDVRKRCMEAPTSQEPRFDQAGPCVAESTWGVPFTVDGQPKRVPVPPIPDDP